MEHDITSIVTRLETRTRQLMFQYSTLKQALAETEQKLAEEKRHCAMLKEENTALEEKYARLKMARLIDMADDDDLRTCRKRINKMIASVDKCLATLKIQ